MKLLDLILVEMILIFFVEVGRIQNHIIKSTKSSLIEKILKRLLEFNFEKHNSIKTKCFKHIFKKNTAISIKMTGKQY